MDKEEAIKATKNGAIAACISGCLTLAVVSFAIFKDASGSLAVWNDPSIFADVLLIFACAYGIYKKSRAAAVLLFVYFIIAKIMIGIETGKLTGIGTALVFLYFYGKAIQGAFVFHKIEQTENPDYRQAPKWAYYLGIPALVVFVGLVGMGIMTMVGVMPSTEVLTGNEITKSNLDTLIANNIITRDDKIEYFYSDGFTSILEGGSILTDDRVILYMPDENQQIAVYEVYFNDIASIELVQEGDSLNDSIYKVNTHEPDAWLQLALSTSNKGDIKFIESLRTKVVMQVP